MPYRSARQKRFMEMCRNNPGDSNKICPPKKVLDEFHRASYHAHKRRDATIPKARKSHYVD